MGRNIKVGADPFPPYQYIREDGTVAGLDYARVMDIFQKAGYTADVELCEWSEVQRRLDIGEFEAVFQVQPTPERVENYYLSRPLRNAVTEVVTVNREILLKDYVDIEKQRLTLGVIQGYTNGPDIDALDDGVKLVYPSAAALLQAISRGEVDLGIYDRGVREYLMREYQITNVFPIDSMTYVRPLHVMFRSVALRDAFDRAMETVNP